MVAKQKLTTAILLFALAGTQGCGYTQRFIKKPWGWGTVVPALVCGGVGAGTGWIIQNNRPGCSNLDEADGSHTGVCDNKEHWKGASIGGAIGVVLCGLAGHALFDPEPSPRPTPEPPPPPPSPTPAPPTMKKRIVLRGVNFDFDKSDIRPDSRPVLEEAAATLMAEPGIRVAVEGHTDALGTDMYNKGLAERRANAVYRYLVSAGIAPNRLEVKGFGESRPVADNSTESGRAQNRRVELRILPQ